MGYFRSNPPIKWPQEIIFHGEFEGQSPMKWRFDNHLTFEWSDISLTIWNFVKILLDSAWYFPWYLNVRQEMSDQLEVWHWSDNWMVWHQFDNLKLCSNISRFCQIFSLVSKCQTGNVRPTGGLTLVWQLNGLTSVWQFETLFKYL